MTAWRSYKGFRGRLLISSFLKREQKFWERNLPNWTSPLSEGFENIWYFCTARNLFAPVFCRAMHKSFVHHTVLGVPASRSEWVLTTLIHQQKYCIYWGTEDKDFRPVEESVLHQFVFFLLIHMSGSKTYSLNSDYLDYGLKIAFSSVALVLLLILFCQINGKMSLSNIFKKYFPVTIWVKLTKECFTIKHPQWIWKQKN